MLARSSGVVNDRSSALSAKSSAASTARSSWMLMMRLVSSTAPLGSRAMRCAQAIAWSSTSSSGQTWLTRPISAARAGRDAVPRQRVLLGQLQAGEQRPHHGPAVGRHQAEEHVGVGQVRALAP